MRAWSSRRRAPVVVRVLRTELLRGAALLTALMLVVALGFGLYAHTSSWAGRWLGLGIALRNALDLGGPVLVAGAVWAAGRERRRGAQELLASTSRPPWQRAVLGWSAVSFAGALAMAGVWAAGAWFVAPVATYGGGRLWHPLVAVVSVGTLVAAGTVVGRFVPWRGAAPVAAIVAFYLLSYGGSGQIDDGRMWLSPTLPQWPSWALDLHADGGVLAVLWFAALTATLLVLAGARRRWWALVPGLAAVVVAVPLGTGAAQERWPLPPSAVQEVCAGGVPRVCVTQVSAFMLDDLRRHVETVWERLDGVEGAPTVVREAPHAASVIDPQTVELRVDRTDVRGRLEWSSSQDEDLLLSIVGWPQCELPEGDGDGAAFRENQTAVYEAAALLLTGRSTLRWGLDPASEPVRERLSAELDALPADARRTWLGNYLTATRTTGPCDGAALDALLEIS